MPRHPPIALISLDRSHCQCPSLSHLPEGKGRIRLPFTTKSKSRCHQRVRPDPHMKARRCTSRPDLKTSFSRSVRGCAVRQHPSACRQRKPETPKSPNPCGLEVSMVQTTNNKHALSNKLPTYLQSLHCVGSARPSTALTGLGSDVSNDLSITLNTWKLPDISSLHNVIRTGIRLKRTDANFYFSIRQGKQSANYNTTDGFKNRRYGGAYRDRTDDPLLAKQVLSQLS
jgi:hypothetical protein